MHSDSPADPVPQSPRASPSPSAAVLQHVHSYNRAYFHQLMRQRLEAQQPRQQGRNGSVTAVAGASPTPPDDPRLEPRLPQDLLSTPPSIVCSPTGPTATSASVLPAKAQSASPQPRQPLVGEVQMSSSSSSSTSSQPRQSPRRSSRSRSAPSSSSKRRHQRGAPRDRVDAAAAFGSWELYRKEDQQPLSARSRSTITMDERASSSPSFASSLSSSAPLQNASHQQGEAGLVESAALRHSRQMSHTRRHHAQDVPSGGVADVDTLRRLLSLPQGEEERHRSPRTTASSVASGGDRRPTSRHRQPHRRQGQPGPVVRFKEPSVPSEEEAAPTHRVSAQSVTPALSSSQPSSALPPEAWMTRSGLEKMCYARLRSTSPSTSASVHASPTQSALPSPQAAVVDDMPNNNKKTQPNSEKQIRDLSLAAAETPADEQRAATARLLRELDDQRDELSHLRAALVVAGNHITRPASSSARVKTLDQKTAQVLALATVVGSRHTSDRQVRDTTDVTEGTRASVAAVLSCLERTDPRAVTRAPWSAGLTLDRLLRGMPTVPLTRPSHALRDRLSHSLQQPFCGILTVLLPSAVMHAHDHVAERKRSYEKGKKKKTSPKKKKTVTSTLASTGSVRTEEGRSDSTQGAFTLSATAPALPPSVWSSLFDTSVSVGDAFTWATCFVVADDRGVTVFRRAEDYMAGAYTRALVTLPYTVFSCFLSDLRTHVHTSDHTSSLSTQRVMGRPPRQHSDLFNESDDSRNNTTAMSITTAGTKTNSRGLLQRLFSRRRREKSADADSDDNEEAPQNGSRPGQQAATAAHASAPGRDGEFARYLTQLFQSDRTEHYFGFLPVASRVAARAAGDEGTGRADPVRVHGHLQDNADASQEVPSIWSLSRRDVSERPPLLFRTPSEQVRGEWVHTLAQRFDPPLYLDLFPRFVDAAVTAASRSTQTEVNGSSQVLHLAARAVNDAPVGTDVNDTSAAVRAIAATTDAHTQTGQGAVVAVRDLLVHGAELDGVAPAAALNTTAPPSSSPPPESSTPLTQGLTHVSAELRQLLERKNEQLVESERAVHATQARVEALLATQQQLQRELAEVRAREGDYRLAEGHVQEELSRLRTVAERATADLAELRAKQAANGKAHDKNEHTAQGTESHSAAEEVEDVVAVMQAEREIWKREKDELIATQQRLAAEVLAVRHESTEGLRALARRAVGDLDLLHDEMLKDTNSFIASASAAGVSPILPIPHAKKNHGRVRAPPGLPHQETHDREVWAAAPGADGRHRAAPVGTVEVAGDSDFADVHCGKPRPAAAPASAVAAGHVEHLYGSPGMVDSPRFIEGGEDGAEEETLPSTPGRQLFSTLLAPSPSDRRAPSPPQAPPSGTSSALPLAQLLVTFDPARRALDADLVANAARTRLLSSGPTKRTQGRCWELYHHQTGLTLSVTMTVAAHASTKQRHRHGRARLAPPPPPSPLQSVHGRSSAGRYRPLTTTSLSPSVRLEEEASAAMPWTSPHPYGSAHPHL